MNSGSIHNPTTLEARLFAFLLQHIGQEFSCGDLAPHLNHTPCAHTYIDGMRDQAELIGYQVIRTQRGRLHYYKIVKASKTFTPSEPRPKPRPAKRVKNKASMSLPVPSAGQMNLLEAVA